MDQAQKATMKAKMSKVISEKMQTMNALMKLKVKHQQGVVVVTETIDLNRGHAQQLKVRNSKF